MSASTCGSSTAVGTGKSDRCTELPSERLRYMASETKGANGAINPDTVRRASYRVWYAAALSRSDCDFQKRLRDRRMYQLERSSTNRWMRRAGGAGVVAGQASGGVGPHPPRL